MSVVRTIPGWVYVLALLCVLLLSAAGVVIHDRLKVDYWHQQTDAESLIARSATSTDHVLGNLSAPVQLIVYQDLSCTYCKSFFTTTLPKLQSLYGDKLVVIFRNLPLSSHPNSRLEAQAAECVNVVRGESAYWSFLRSVFSQPDYASGLGLDRLVALAQSLGVPGTQMRSCIQSGMVDARIDKDALEASVAGIQETPSVVLKSATRALVVQGDYLSPLRAGIDYLLQSATTTGT